MKPHYLIILSIVFMMSYAPPLHASLLDTLSTMVTSMVSAVLTQAPIASDISVKNAHLTVGSNCVSMTLTNHAKLIDALVGAKTSIAEEIVLIDQGMHRDVPKIELLPTYPLKIEPGHGCIILRRITSLPKVGDTFKLTLIFSNARKKEVTVEVVADKPKSDKKGVAP